MKKLCHKMKVYRRGSNGSSRAEIRLLGKWIEQAGFTIGSPICVTILDGKIVIEKGYTEEEDNFNGLNDYFMEKDERLNIKKWIRDKGGISSTSCAADIFELKQKESGYKGKSSLVRKNGKALDILRDEAVWEQIIPDTMSTDEFGDMIKSQVLRKEYKVDHRAEQMKQTNKFIKDTLRN